MKSPEVVNQFTFDEPSDDKTHTEISTKPAQVEQNLQKDED